MTTRYSEPDVRAGYSWFAHRDWTELLAVHPEFRQGPEHRTWNQRNNTYPKIAYARGVEDVVPFVAKHHGTHLVAFSVNERPQAFRNDHGYFRAAREQEIQAVSSFLVDIDYVGSATTARDEALTNFLTNEAASYFRDLGLQAPAYAVTGNGGHLLIAAPRTMVADNPDISVRFAAFIRHLREDFRRDLETLEAKIDSTSDLRRMVRAYGTGKPGRDGLSRFYGATRVEDSAFLELLLCYSMAEDRPGPSPAISASFGPTLIVVYDRLPAVFESLVERDARLRNLWNGAGKSEGSDTSGSGYDISLVRRAMALGIHDISHLATILALRPGGSVQRNSKGEHYIRRTIARALAPTERTG